MLSDKQKQSHSSVSPRGFETHQDNLVRMKMQALTVNHRPSPPRNIRLGTQGLRPGGLDYLLRPPMQIPSPQHQNQQQHNANPTVLSQLHDHKSVSNPSYFFL